MNYCIISTETTKNEKITVCHVCKEEFHYERWIKWMKNGKGCPNCRYCAQDELLTKLIPDIPADICNSLTSFEKYNLCKIAIMLELFKNKY